MTARQSRDKEILSAVHMACCGAALVVMVAVPTTAQGPELTSPPGLQNSTVIVRQEGAGSQTFGPVTLQPGMLIAEAWRHGEGTLMVQQVDERGVTVHTFLLLASNGRARNIVAIPSARRNVLIRAELTGRNRETDAWGVTLYQDPSGPVTDIPLSFSGGADVYGPIDFGRSGAPYARVSWEYVGGQGSPPMHLVNATGHAIAIIGDPRLAGDTGSQIVDQQGPLWFSWVTDATLNGYLELRVRIESTNQAPGAMDREPGRAVTVGAAAADEAVAVSPPARPPRPQPEQRAAPAVAAGTAQQFRQFLEPRLQRALGIELNYMSGIENEDQIVIMWGMTQPGSSAGLANLITELGAQAEVRSMAGTTMIDVHDLTIEGTRTAGNIVVSSGQLIVSLRVKE